MRKNAFLSYLLQSTFTMNKKQQIKNLVESFVKSLEKKYNLIKEADEEMELNYNPASRAMRQNVIDRLISPPDEGLKTKPGADRLKAQEIAKAILANGSRARVDLGNDGKTFITYQSTLSKAQKQGESQASPESQTLDLVIEYLVQLYNTPEGEPGILGVSAVTPEMKRNIKDGFQLVFYPLDFNGKPNIFFYWIWYGPKIGFAAAPPKPYELDPTTGTERLNREKMVDYTLTAYEAVISRAIQGALGRSIENDTQKTSAYITASIRNAIKSEMRQEARTGNTGINAKGMKNVNLRGDSMSAHLNRDEKGAGDDKTMYDIHKAANEEPYFDLKKYGDLGMQVAQDIEAELYALGGTKPPMHQKELFSSKIHNQDKGFNSLKSFAEWTLQNLDQTPALAEYLSTKFPGQDEKFYVKKIMNELQSLYSSGKFLKIREDLFHNKYANMLSADAELGPIIMGDFFGIDQNSPEGRSFQKLSKQDTKVSGVDPSSGKEREFDVMDPYDMDAYYQSLREAVNIKLLEYALNKILLLV